jgi:bifunctional pyridoxal-dependent enzyme with beta-cystathionase and maltose regulon repressor activities
MNPTGKVFTAAELAFIAELIAGTTATRSATRSTST